MILDTKAGKCSTLFWLLLKMFTNTVYDFFLFGRTWQLCSTAVEQQKEFSGAEVFTQTHRAVQSLVLCSFCNTSGSTVCMWLAADLNIDNDSAFRVLSVQY